LAKVGVDIKINQSNVIAKPEGPLHYHKINTAEIGTIHIHPGISAEILNNYLRQPVKGLILITYGAGNIPSHNDDLVAAIADACERGIVIVNCTHCIRGSVDMSAYEAGSILEQAGVVNGKDMTLESCITKLSWLLGQHQDPDKIRNLMAENLRGELRA